MTLEKKLTRIDIEIQNGLKMKASDRLRNMINQYPNEPEIWNKLAQLYYDSGFLASAGKYWILTEPKHDQIKNCVAIYEKSVNYSGAKILQDITFRGNKSKLSEYGKNKLTELELDSKNKSNYIPTFKPITNKKNRIQKKEVPSFKNKVYEILFYSIIITTVLLIIIGFVTVLSWIL